MVAALARFLSHVLVNKLGDLQKMLSLVMALFLNNTQSVEGHFSKAPVQ